MNKSAELTAISIGLVIFGALLMPGCATRPMPEGVTVCPDCTPEGGGFDGLVAYVERDDGRCRIVVVKPESYTADIHRHELEHCGQPDYWGIHIKEGFAYLAEIMPEPSQDVRTGFVEARIENARNAYANAALYAIEAGKTCLSDPIRYQQTSFDGGL